MILTMKVCVVGLGYVGLTLAITLSDCGVIVYGVDSKKETVLSLRNGKPTISEKNVVSLLQKHLGTNLHILENIPEMDFDAYMICVGTPLNSKNSPILDYIISASEETGTRLKKGQVVILRSTIPVGTTRNIVIPILEEKSNLKSGVDFDVVFAPERTAEGVALSELKTNPQIIGSLTSEGIEKTSLIFKQMTPTIIPVSSIETAEMMKLIDNTYRDVRFAYANEIAIICETLKLDAKECIEKANFQYPRNNIPMPSPGVGGPCLSKDPYILAHVASQYGYKPEIIAHSRWVNEYIPSFLAKKVVRKIEMMGGKGNLKIFIIGFAFKGNPETGDIRNSPTLILVEELKKHFTNIVGYDPIVPTSDIENIGIKVTTIQKGFEDADCVVVMNNHESYHSLNMRELLRSASKPCVFVDCWSMFRDLRKNKELIYTGVGID